MEETRVFRGISKRLAVRYLENIGGERVDAGEGSAASVEGDGWSAAVSAETVGAAGSIELTEVTVDFEGEEGSLEPVVEAFARKAIRAGG